MKPLAMLLFSAALLSAGTIDDLKAEPDLQKRSEKAMKAADTAFSAARRSYQDGQPDKEATALAELRDAVELAMLSLSESGKDARRNPKYFKKTEISLRKLIRQLEDHNFAKSVEEREPITKLIAFLHQAQDEVLLGIMTKKK
jgi:hypothetical protein